MINILTNKISIGVIGLLVGIVGGSASAEEKIKTSTVEVEKTVEVPVEKIVDREVEVTPQVCLDAIEYAREGFGITSETMYVMSDFLGAASEFDIDEMTAQTRKMGPLNRELEALAPKFKNAATACEAS